MHQVSCIIPAFNEGPRITGVLEIVENHPMITETIVINDGSRDDTEKIVTRFSRVKILTHSINKGKTQALLTGVKEAPSDYVLLLDADLTGLTKQAVSDLIEPIFRDKAEIIIGSLGNHPGWWKNKSMDYLAGTRVLPKKIIIDNIDAISQLPRFGFEAYIDKVIVKQKYPIKTVDCPNVKHAFKYQKRGLWRGLLEEIKMTHDVLKVLPPWEIIRTIAKMRQLKV